MKKILAVVLTLAMIFAVSVSATATLSSTSTEATKDISGTYSAGTPGATVYSVDVSWGNMSFTYTGASDGTWDPSTHTYTGGSAAGWSADGNTVTVTNHSNTGVKVKFEFAAETGITGSFDKTGEQSLNTAVGTAVASAPSVTGTLSITAGTISATGKIGTAKVTLVLPT